MYWGILKYMHSKRRKGLAAYDIWSLELNDMVNSHYYAIHELFFAVQLLLDWLTW